MRQLLFRLCQSSDGQHFAFLTDQPEVEDRFDSGYKIAYKYRDRSNGLEQLAHWYQAYSVKSVEFEALAEAEELPEAVQKAFDIMIAQLIVGVDVFFCDYNLAIEADLPICNNMMDRYRSTDFVLFSCDQLVGNDPTTQPYMVSYAAPRYLTGQKIAQQHRIYSKTDHFAFCQAIHAIVLQRERDALNGGHIRSEEDHYIAEKNVDDKVAQQALNRFAELITQLNQNGPEVKRLGQSSDPGSFNAPDSDSQFNAPPEAGHGFNAPDSSHGFNDPEAGDL
ncbi:hypothetical protein [Celerinatantimonas sp. YJH-8]|uniref:hypothetical protein n=1 Tax=Celerinatantimonas sp. YJH-8 TaxID=3228714 RepID=UPI0038CB5BDA